MVDVATRRDVLFGKSIGSPYIVPSVRPFRQILTCFLTFCILQYDETLTGRGKPFQEHEGNIKLSKLIESRQAEYAKANRAGKTLISWEIVRLIQRDGGSFLKKDECSGAWKKETDEIAREKVSHGFRTKSKQRLPGMEWLQEFNSILRPNLRHTCKY